MPIIKSAIKKMRQDATREKRNQSQRSGLKTILQKAHLTKDKEVITLAISLVDRAAKKNLIHANKASRKKSALMKLTTSTEKAPQTKIKAKVVKKKTKK